MDSDDLVIIESEATSMAGTPPPSHSHPSPPHPAPSVPQKTRTDFAQSPTPTCAIQAGCQCHGCQMCVAEGKHVLCENSNRLNPFESEQVSCCSSREHKKPPVRGHPVAVIPYRSRTDVSRHSYTAASPLHSPPPPPVSYNKKALRV